ncbi:WD40-repeat-containing domain protein [Xylaria cf. heliscus]|nr:WD40-repeat-containing domain protein [Xylaria cf. heliscus]
MRSQNTPPGSPPFEPDRPIAEEDVPLQTHSVGSATNTSSDHLSAAYQDLQSSEPTSLLHLPAHAQNHHNSIAEGVDEAEAADEEENNDYDMVDVEEGGAPLYDIDMEETNDQPPVPPPLQDTAPLLDLADGSINNVALQSFILAEANPPTGPVIVGSPQPALEQDEDDQDALDLGAEAFEPHPLFLNQANTGMLMPDNYNFLDFLRLWVWHKSQNRLKDIKGTPRNVFSITKVKQPRITYDDLKGDEYDIQGINWKHLGVTRSLARKYRAKSFRTYTNLPNSDTWSPSIPDRLLTRHGNYFRFRSMDLRTDVRLLHFQLRSIMGCASRTAVYYPCVSGTVRRLDPTTGKDKVAMRFKTSDDALVSTLAAEEGMLVTGSFYGTYRYRRLDTEGEPWYYDGRLTGHNSSITNHVQVYSSRYSSTPIAAFASNDYGFRMVDLARNETILDTMYDYPLNCTALSTDKRLRVMVGDRKEVMITEAETGKILVDLEGHRDFGFACDWAPDGWTVATGNQDKSIRIWDARKWKNSQGRAISVSEIRSEMAAVRSLRFSPLGSGKRLLLAAEEADVINIIDAQTYNSKQTIDFFGELAGVSFTSAGQEVVALSSDPVRGGVLCLSRCDYGVEDTFDYTPKRHSRRASGYDWLPTPQQVVHQAGSEVTLTQKRRQAAMAEDWFF